MERRARSRLCASCALTAAVSNHCVRENVEQRRLYRRYLRERKAQMLSVSRGVCSAVVDDFENDMVLIDDHEFGEEDEL